MVDTGIQVVAGGRAVDKCVLTDRYTGFFPVRILCLHDGTENDQDTGTKETRYT
jgi:hypothetical protein